MGRTTTPVGLGYEASGVCHPTTPLAAFGGFGQGLFSFREARKRLDAYLPRPVLTSSFLTKRWGTARVSPSLSMTSESAFHAKNVPTLRRDSLPVHLV